MEKSLDISVRVSLSKRNSGEFLSFEESFQMKEQDFSQFSKVLGEFHALAEKLKQQG